MSTQSDGAVVVGVAESVFKGWALPWAAQQAQLEGRPLVLVNASGPVSGAWREYGMDSVPSSSATLRAHGERLLARARAVVEKSAPDVPVTELFEVVDPSALLVQCSSTAHLLVLGSRGRGPVRSHLLGSVGLAVVRHAACPVVVHRPGDHPGLVHRGVIVAADATAESEPVLAFAFREAKLLGLPLTVVHYVYDVRSALVGAPMSGTLSEDTEEHARALAGSLEGFRKDYPDVHLTVETLPGLLPEQGLAQLGREADLTVVGTHQRGLLGRWLAGSVSESVLEHVPGAVAVVPTRSSRTP
jgi:nucleotide-binding universal stress UspA family protein